MANTARDVGAATIGNLVGRTIRFWTILRSRKKLSENCSKVLLEIQNSPEGWQKFQQDHPPKVDKIRELSSQEASPRINIP